MAVEALECFRRQTYQPRQLVIVDDMMDRSFGDDVSQQPDVKYIQQPGRLSIGRKRNIACAYADGEIICHWDSDDISAPGRIADQVERLLASGAELTGYHTMIFMDGSGRRWLYRGRPPYAIGTSFMYWQKLWLRNPFPLLNMSEDHAFLGRAARVESVDAAGMMTARVHSDNTNKTVDRLNKPPWERICT